MELLVLFALLPVAAASGWWMARKSAANQGGMNHQGDFSSDYFAGLNFLLNEQPDKAIDVFVKMLEVNSDTVETYLALGSLFRRRGEGDRAIRIHQNLIARPTLSREQRAQAVFELGKDYYRAGFLGRAENLFLELLEDKQYRVPALKLLLEIYQQERDWDKAIGIARKLQGASTLPMNVQIGQFYCEQADALIQQGDVRGAIKLAKKAISNDKNCARASLILARLESSQGNFKAAIKHLRQVEKQNPEYIAETVPGLIEAYQSLNKLDELEQYLSELTYNYNGLIPVIGLAEVTRLRHDEKTAAQKLLQALRKAPSIDGLNQYLQLNLVNADEPLRAQLEELKSVTAGIVEKTPHYTCNNCGFKAKTLHWQCPTCRQWCSVKPSYIVEAEKSK